jgi:hypothetical protein
MERSGQGICLEELTKITKNLSNYSPSGGRGMNTVLANTKLEC